MQWHLVHCTPASCRIQQYLRERQAREDEEAARKAGKQEVADRIYERLKEQAQAEAAAREEEDRLINLLRAEEEAERARRWSRQLHPLLMKLSVPDRTPVQGQMH